MVLAGYLEHLDLGVDESGQPNILVRSVQEYNALTEEEKARAWSTIKVAGEISERVAVALYQHVYTGKLPSKTIKKNTWDRRGLVLVKVSPKTLKTKADRRADDITRMTRAVRRTMKAASWLPEAQRLLVGAIFDTKLRNIERELFSNGGKA